MFNHGLSFSAVQDSTALQLREFNKEVITEYQADEAFNYGYKPVENLSLWKSFLNWLGQILSELFFFGTENPIGKYLLIGLALAVFIFALLKILKIRTNIFLKDKAIYNAKDNIHEENIHELDLYTLIARALKEENYRNAIRLTYLLALKILSDKDMVKWIPGKTNSDYLYEIKTEQVKKGFRDLIYYFTYTWYGNFEVEERHYAKVKSIFEDWSGNVNK